MIVSIVWRPLGSFSRAVGEARSDCRRPCSALRRDVPEPERMQRIVGPAQQRLHLGDQHFGIEGLCDKLIPAHVHGHDNVHIVRRGGNEDHRHRGNLAYLRTPVIPVHERKHDIQQYQMRLNSCKVLHYMSEVRYGFNLQASLRHVVRNRAGNTGVIFHNHNSVIHTSLLCIKCQNPLRSLFHKSFPL